MEPPTPPKVRAPLGKLKVLEVIDENTWGPDRVGRLVEERLLRTSFKHPLVRTVDVYKVDMTNGARTMVRSEAMVGDHLIVRLPLPLENHELPKALLEQGYAIRTVLNPAGVYLISFRATRSNSLTEARAMIQTWLPVRYIEPDYLVTVNGEGGSSITVQPPGEAEVR